jgi:hypothetical protein
VAALGYRSYREYLESPHWADVKAKFYAGRTHRHCDACHGDGRVAIHHKTYKRLGRESTGDLMLLCDRCHKQVHAYPGQSLWWISQYLKKTRGAPPQPIPISSAHFGPTAGERPPWEITSHE